MENLSRVFQKQKRKKRHMKRLSFITQFKIEFLLPFNGCRKVLRKMRDYVKSVQIRSFLWSLFSRIQFEYGKIRIRKNFVFGHFSHSVQCSATFKNIFQYSVEINFQYYAVNYSRVLKLTHLRPFKASWFLLGYETLGWNRLKWYFSNSFLLNIFIQWEMGHRIWWTNCVLVSSKRQDKRKRWRLIPDAHLEPSPTSTMELFCKNSSQILAGNYFSE